MACIATFPGTSKSPTCPSAAAAQPTLLAPCELCARPPPPGPARCSLQFLIAQSAQRVFLVAGGGLERLEGGVAEYVAQLSGKKKVGGGKAGGKGKGGSEKGVGKK